jgi:putative GTP pyrophosphokinase
VNSESGTSSDSSGLQRLEDEYKGVASSAEQFATELARQIGRLVLQRGISLGFPIQSRLKTWNSIAEKVQRLSFNARRITDFQDLVGLRLVLLFQRDVHRICELLEREFAVTKRYDTIDRLKSDQFGYSSVHLVLALPESWLAIPAFSPMRGLRAEVQVRTVAQHMWAEASHALQYKQESSVPAPVLRAIHRASALLETVDLEFHRVLEERETYRAEIVTGSTDQRLSDVDFLSRTLDGLLPPANRTDSEEYSELLAELQKFGVLTSGELHKLVTEYLPESLRRDASAVRERAGSSQLSAEARERIRRGVFLTHTGMVRTMLSAARGHEYDRFLVQQSGRRV